MKKIVFAFTFALAGVSLLSGADVKLPVPDKKGGMPLMQALNQRKTIRAYSDKELSMQTVSDLLWAASGVNRADGRMTAPTARNLQEISLYVLIPTGIYRYDGAKNSLVQVSNENITKKVTGKAPLTVVFVADTLKQPQIKYQAVDCGYISQNIYLYCASAGLGTVVRGMYSKDFIAKLKLPKGAEVLFIQSVGYPK